MLRGSFWSWATVEMIKKIHIITYSMFVKQLLCACFLNKGEKKTGDGLDWLPKFYIASTVTWYFLHSCKPQPQVFMNFFFWHISSLAWNCFCQGSALYQEGGRFYSTECSSSRENRKMLKNTICQNVSNVSVFGFAAKAHWCSVSQDFVVYLLTDKRQKTSLVDQSDS